MWKWEDAYPLIYKTFQWVYKVIDLRKSVFKSQSSNVLFPKTYLPGNPPVFTITSHLVHYPGACKPPGHHIQGKLLLIINQSTTNQKHFLSFYALHVFL